MKALGRFASVALILAWLVFMFAGFRSNTILLETARAPVSYCQSHPSDFQMVDMKGPSCVSAGAARRWNENKRLMNWAVVVGAALFIALFAAQLRSRGRKAAP